ncbi:hypothetical protein L228DRAFT_155092 [Xylona heveae TC161]|uniref:Uncharacterized protein n=1 Tax=Xylona heveae (strain CBS 132557 / TC161) TaxID=1328760 RepID=A0A165FY36_XYLHT|nr:hypothetical protein L228DRAFT_155092 [Xylona heveae TC161]KZF21522.1 hypothetical protein L228DRAFT_155092 [Xylona heveae TC161]
MPMMTPKRKEPTPSDKLQRLPSNYRVKKRPLMHAPIASPYTGRREAKIVYISTHTPFISAVKRVRKFLEQVDKRTMGKVDLLGPGKDAAKIAQTGRTEQGEPEEILIKATGKAIEKALNLGLFFQGQEDCRVRIRTGTVGTVDDIVEVEGQQPAPVAPRTDEMEKGKGKGNGDSKADVEMKEAEVDAKEEEKQEEENEQVPEAQIRMTSMVEIAVSLR